MEKCEACGRNLFINSRNEQKRFDAFKARTSHEFCSSCRKKYENEEVENIVLEAIGKVFTGALRRR